MKFCENPLCELHIEIRDTNDRILVRDAVDIGGTPRRAKERRYHFRFIGAKSGREVRLCDVCAGAAELAANL